MKSTIRRVSGKKRRIRRHVLDALFISWSVRAWLSRVFNAQEARSNINHAFVFLQLVPRRQLNNFRNAPLRAQLFDLQSHRRTESFWSSCQYSSHIWVKLSYFNILHHCVTLLKSLYLSLTRGKQKQENKQSV